MDVPVCGIHKMAACAICSRAALNHMVTGLRAGKITDGAVKK